MQLYTFILIPLVVQLALYLILDSKKRATWKWLILIILIGLFIFVFPQFFYPEAANISEPQCGLPIVAIHSFFILFGVGGALLLHMIYALFRIIFRKSRYNNIII